MRAIFLPLLLLLPPALALAQEKPASITVRGEALTKVIPDEALIPVTVTTENINLAEAKKLNDAKLAHLLEISANYGIAKEDMRTEYNSIEPIYSQDDAVAETNVYQGNLTFTIYGLQLGEDKVNALMDEVEKKGLSNVNISSKTISGVLSDSDPERAALLARLNRKKAEILEVMAAQGIPKEKIFTNLGESRNKITSNVTPRQRIISYRVSVNVVLAVKDKEKAPPLVNDVIKAGIDTIGSISFDLRDEKAVKDKTLIAALQEANEKARMIAQAVGAELGKPVTIEEGGAQVINPYSQRPVMAFAMARNAAAPATPELPSGQIEVRQSVTVTYAIK